METVTENVYLFRDTCNVYVIRRGADAVLIDFGSGDVLDELPSIGVQRVTAILMTHHHRDQGQGLDRAVAANIPIWVPHTEQDLFAHVDAHWQAREVFNNYNMRQDRFSLLEPVPIAGTLRDYAVFPFGDLKIEIIPTPGHTTGSISLLLEIDEKRLGFVGDLIAAPGKVWTLSATQFTYNGTEGIRCSMASLLELEARSFDKLLPSHGNPMSDPALAVELLVARLVCVLDVRGETPRLFALRQQPYEAVTPHLLRNRTSMSNSYVLLSDSKKALVIDFGYDFLAGLAQGTDRASRRPLLYTIPTLKRQYGIEKIEVALPTHYHDDHVAGLNLLREVEGTQVWAAENFADILENPTDYDLPCLWYDAIPVDCRVPLEVPIRWEEYTFTLYPLPGHTEYAVAIVFEVDGYRILAGGDQYAGASGLELNYVYPNRFHADDYVKSAALYRQINPDLIITGHWKPMWVTPDYFDKIETLGCQLERLHHELLPDALDLGGEGFIARLTPYQATAEPGQLMTFEVEIRNPLPRPADAAIRIVAPKGWSIPEVPPIPLDARKPYIARFELAAPSGFRERRARIAVDITIDGQRFGQQAEALVSASEMV